MNIHSFFSSLFHSKLVKGTFILTIASVVTRILGFFYRIYLAKVFSEEGMGIIQLSFPILTLFYSICASGIQAAISRFTASKRRTIFFYAGTFLSFLFSILCGMLLYHFSSLIAISFLKEIRCTPLLKIHALSLPFCTLHACINGYFIGLQKASIPALSQVLEQLTRVGTVYFFVSYAVFSHLQISLSLAILGSFLGELVSSVFSLFAFFWQTTFSSLQTLHHLSSLDRTSLMLSFSEMQYANKMLLSHAVPISCNHLFMSCLHSLEATLIPQQLVYFGLSQSSALSQYGVLTGMALPLVYFPASFTNAICILLLPAIAKAQAKQQKKVLKRTYYLSALCSICIGCLSSFIFIPFGNFLGIFLFSSQQAGFFIHTLGYLCPIFYLPSILSCILNGLGFVKKTLLHNVMATLIRLGFIIYIVPIRGLSGYLYGLFASQLLLTILNFLALHRYIVYNDSGLSEITIRKESHHGI